MKKLLALGLISLFVGLAAIPGVTAFGAQDRRTHQAIQNRFIGAWRLIWLEEPDANGRIHRADCAGLLVFTRDGHMSVQVMYRSPQSGGDAGPVQYAQGGYEASYGTFKIEDARTFMYHVDAALVRSLIGKNFARVFELSGKQLIVKSPDPNERWRVGWEHY